MIFINIFSTPPLATISSLIENYISLSPNGKRLYRLDTLATPPPLRIGNIPEKNVYNYGLPLSIEFFRQLMILSLSEVMELTFEWVCFTH